MIMSKETRQHQMEETTMTSTEIKEILKGKFESEADRQYWVCKLKETERKEKNAQENENYYRKNIVYNR